MKKYYVVALAIVLAMALTGCGIYTTTVKDSSGEVYTGTGITPHDPVAAATAQARILDAEGRKAKADAEAKLILKAIEDPEALAAIQATNVAYGRGQGRYLVYVCNETGSLKRVGIGVGSLQDVPAGQPNQGAAFFTDNRVITLTSYEESGQLYKSSRHRITGNGETATGPDGNNYDLMVIIK